MYDGTDVLVEIITGPPFAPVASQFDVVNLSDRVLKDDFGSVNRAMERDLLSFKTGDLTLGFDDSDGFFESLFSQFGTTDRWQMRVEYSGIEMFRGIVIGKGSVTFNKKTRACTITAYGPSKVIGESNAETVKRTFGAMSLTANAGAGATTLTLNSTSGLLSADVLHLTDHVNAEDVTVRKVTSGTQVLLEAGTAHAYNSGSDVTNTTPFYRYKSIDYLVRALFAAASVPVREVKLNQSQFKRLVPSPVNLEGLSLNNDARRGSVQRNGRWQVGIATEGSFYQSATDGAWTQEDATDRGWVDWSPYYVEGSSEPPLHLRDPHTNSDESGTTEHTGISGGGYDFKSATRRAFGIAPDFPDLLTATLRQRTTVDGTTWTASSPLSVLPVSDDVDTYASSVDYDPVRNIVYCSWYKRLSSNGYLRYWDLNGSTWVDMKPAGDSAGTGYFGVRYIADLDLMVCLRGTNKAGPAFSICAFRGATKLWEQPFPNCNVAPNVGSTRYYPTRSARYIGGAVYITLVSDGAVQLIRGDSVFQTYSMKKILSNTSDTRIACCRFDSTYRIACYNGTVAKGYFIAAPLYAGVILNADFEGKTVAEALADFAVLTNAFFWVDDSLEGHFLARDLFTGDVLDITDRVMEHEEDLHWDETRHYAVVAGADASGGQISEAAGDAAFAGDKVDLESAHTNNAAFASALAQNYADFYAKRRRVAKLVVDDVDGHIYRPGDRVTLDGTRFMVYESDHDLMERTVNLELLED